jgi:hypothetical protein
MRLVEERVIDLDSSLHKYLDTPVEAIICDEPG